MPEGIQALPGRAVETHERFKHVMALALNPKTSFQDGVIRCITDREGSVDVSGFVDHSQLYTVAKKGKFQYEICERLAIENEDRMIGPLLPNGFEFLGLEDPDLFVDEEGNLHLYCTVPLFNRKTGRSRIYLGHACGDSLEALCMQEPVLTHTKDSAKEVSLAPSATDGIRRHLIESSAPGGKFMAYSTVRVAKTRSANAPWEFGETIFHPGKKGIPWAEGHASPGPFVPRSFIDVGEGKLLGFLNGREHDRVHNEQVVFGAFTVGLFIYDFEHGEICWVSKTPILQDEEAKTITFASYFLETGPAEGILYAHVDDSFVRAYAVTAQSLRHYISDINKE
jgi:hypothetical protein